MYRVGKCVCVCRARGVSVCSYYDLCSSYVGSHFVRTFAAYLLPIEARVVATSVACLSFTAANVRCSCRHFRTRTVCTTLPLYGRLYA